MLGLSFLALEERPMDEISGDGVIIIDGENVDQVFYWLTISPEPGDVIAEGSITGSETLMRKVKNARSAKKLALMDGPTVMIRCEGGRNGVRWVKAMRASG
jgi:hypothetical protein